MEPTYRVQMVNAQREAAVDIMRLSRLARRVLRQLKVQPDGVIAITFIESRTIRSLNRRFLRHDRVTDVLSFRYEREPRSANTSQGLKRPLKREGEPIVGEILIAPGQARRYATRHGLPYREELARYVVHGLLHWLGHEDRTAAQQRRMRALEDALLGQGSAK